ncbi:ribbon-helix-helix protein, CopG family [Bradyrhizobium sp. LeoA1S1]
MHVRLPREMIEAVDAYSATNAVTRSEAIRRLVELGLKAKK